MLTVEEIEKILRYHLYVAGKEGCSLNVGGLNETTQAIYQAMQEERRMVVNGPDEISAWTIAENDGWNSTAYIQMRNGRLYRERMVRNGESSSVALCFVPGEGCGG